MAELSDILGAFISSIAHARRLADEESVAIAEYYRNHPFLKDVSVPRIRVADVKIDLPVLLEGFSGQRLSRYDDAETLCDLIVGGLENAARELEIKLSRAFVRKYQNYLLTDLRKLITQQERSGDPARAEEVVRVAQIAFSTAVNAGPWPHNEEARNGLLRKISNVANEVAIIQSSDRAMLDASVVTAEVKERAGSHNVTRIQFCLREEGLEWQTAEGDNGEIKPFLSPE